MFPHIRRHPVLWLLVLSGLIGFRVGIHYAEWQVAVETAQVIAGLVHYPAGNPFYIYHLKLWTVLHQLGALALWAGVSEITLSRFISGVMDMLMFQAWALVTYSLSRDVLVALGATIIILFARAVELPATYPIWATGTGHTYGAFGVWTFILVAGLLGSGYYRAGAFLLGVAPAIHPSLGVWLGAAVAISILSDFRKFRVELRPALPFFLAGCAVTTLSLIVYLFMARGVPSADPATTARYLPAFVELWDSHRGRVDMTMRGVRVNMGALALAVVWLTLFRRDVSRSALLLLRIVAVTAAMSLVFAYLSRLPPDVAPGAFLVLMPTRLLNANIGMFAALLFGLAGAYRGRLWSAALLVALAAGLLVADLSLLWTWLETRGVQVSQYLFTPLWPFAIGSIVLVAMAGFERWRRPRMPPADGPPRWSGPRLARLAFAGSALACMAAFEWSSQRAGNKADTIFLDRTNDPFFARVSQGQGLLATGGDLHLMQLRTRRAVLIDGGGLDGLVYSMAAAPEMERILRDVYSVDLLHGRSADMLPEANQRAWTAYSVDQWRRIRATYGVTEILTYANWRLTLEPIAQNGRLILYRIPE